jgi:succinylglutamate desuccinylase
MAEPPEVNIPFTSARDNFYQAAKFGFDAHVKWLDERSHRLRILLQKELIPLAYKGLESMDVDPDTADFYLSIIHNRVDSGGSGSNWQRQFVKETSANMSSLMEHYIGHQDSALTVDEWPIPHVEIVSSRQELTIMDSIPGGLLDISASELHTIIDGPTLIHIPGVDEKIIFISILLHGNETTGLLAIQDVLKKYTTRKLPRSIALFIGNVQAAKHGLRRLDNQSDYNRVWPGTPLETCRETILMKEVFDSVKSKDVLLSIDIHNNTGLNPHYGCITRLDPAYLHLAALFSRTMVFFTHPPGVQSMAFARLCPSVTIECGKVGSQTGLEHAIDFVDACLHIRSIPKRDPITQDIDLFHTVARVTLPEGVSCGLDDSKYDIRIQPEFEYKNFQEVEAGVIFATMETPIKKPFVVSNEAGEDLFNHYFEIHNKEIVLRTSVIPSMLTADSKIIQQDCLCYFMERFPLYR